MNISLNGYGTGYVTLEAAEGLTEGVLAKISANHTAAAAGDGEAFIGPVLSVRDGLALVQLSGICTVAYTGPVPPPWAMICSPRTLPAASRPPKPADALSWSPQWIPLP